MWWTELTTLQQVLFVVAVSVTALLAVQIILMLIGSAGDVDADFSADADFDGEIGDFDADVDGDFAAPEMGGADGSYDIGSDADISGISEHGFATVFGVKLISLRSITAFICIGSWAFYTASFGLETIYALLVGLAFGLAAGCAMAGALAGMQRLQQSGNIITKNAVGKTGNVYLRIPAERKGAGKVHLLVQEKYAEFEAMTDSHNEIATGSQVRVVGALSNNILLVRRCAENKIIVEDSSKRED